MQDTPRNILVTVIVPVYNESAHVREVIERVTRAAVPTGVRREIIVVDDGSTDGTHLVLDDLEREGHVRVHRRAVNGGKGMAIRLGIERAAGDIVLIQDADLEYDPDDHVKVIGPILDGSATVVYGSRFLGSIQGMHLANRIANMILRATANVLYGARLTDEATAYKAFRSDVLRAMRFDARRFEWCPEVTAKTLLLGHGIVEVPISYRGRTVAQGKKIRWWDLLHAMWTLVRYRLEPQAGWRVGRAPEANADDAERRRRAELGQRA